jgi:hypothetical protein
MYVVHTGIFLDDLRELPSISSFDDSENVIFETSAALILTDRLMVSKY